MKKPKIELKNIKTFRGMEGFGLNADIFINGVKCIFVMDAGDGGEIRYEENIYGKDSEKVALNIKLLDDYIASLPAKTSTFGDKTLTIPYDRDILVDELFNEIEKQKGNKKMQKLFNTGIVFGIPDANSYKYMDFKHPLSKIAKGTIQVYVDKIKLQHCKNGVAILNTNLKELGITV